MLALSVPARQRPLLRASTTRVRAGDLQPAFVRGGQVRLRQRPLKAGDGAPDFILEDQEGHEVKLADYRGKKNVVLAFYIKAFTGG
jgi:cytochrome oxidase Cu insertion factor (SCO1/SenC/PrrC family)